jgi:hypothetical protein
MKRCYKSLSSRVPSIPSHVWAMTLFCHSHPCHAQARQLVPGMFSLHNFVSDRPRSVEQSQSKLPNEPDIAYIVMEFT